MPTLIRSEGAQIEKNSNKIYYIEFQCIKNK